MIGHISNMINIENYWDNLYLVSESIEDFIECLEIYVDNNGNQLNKVKVWLADDLMN